MSRGLGADGKSLFQNNLDNGDTGTGGGSSGGGSSKGTGSTGTGGIQNGGGGSGSGGSSGGGSATTTTNQAQEDNTTVNKQVIPYDADLQELFEQSEIFEELLDKYDEGNAAQWSRQYNIYYQRWIQSVDIEEDPNANNPAVVSDPLQIDFGPNIVAARKTNAHFLMTRMPERHLRLLNHRGVKIYVDDRADQSPGWADYAQDEGITSSSTTADGRELGDLSFYHKGRVFVSDASGHGSYNVYVHELAHALDYHWMPEGMEVEWLGNTYTIDKLSDHPDFIKMHQDRIITNTNIRAYYRTGSTGEQSSGRRESFAEGYAAYVTGGREKLKELFKTYITADMFIDILKKQGVID